MNKGSFELLDLRSDSLQKLRCAWFPNNFNSNPAWHLIGGKSRYKENTTELLEVEKLVPNDFEINNDGKAKIPESQFFFTQEVRPILKEKLEADPILCINDVIDSLIESLEHLNGRLDFLNFENLSTDEIFKVVEALRNNLSETGVSNLCKSLSSMNTEQSLQLLPILSSKFVLPKIIELEKDSLVIKSEVCNCATKFPDEIQNFIFTPSLNSDLKSSCIIMALVKTMEIQRYSSLLSEFANHTRELKQWHFSILETCLSIRPDQNTRGKLLKLFLKKAVTFSKDINYAKLILNFTKTNAPFSDDELPMLEEIAALNQTIYKKVIHATLTNYFL